MFGLFKRKQQTDPAEAEAATIDAILRTQAGLEAAAEVLAERESGQNSARAEQHCKHAKELLQFVDTFGDVRGRQLFTQGLTFAEACHVAMIAELQSLRVEVTALAKRDDQDDSHDWWRR